MGKLKRKLFGKGKQKKASSGENTPMLSQETPEKWETHGFQGIKNIAGALLKKATSEKKDAREKLVATQEPKSSDEAICQVIGQKNFFDACNYIFDLEQSKTVDKAKIDALYNKLEERMWELVKTAVQSGDVYEWGLNMCKSEKLLQPSWTLEQEVSVEALCLVRIFSNLEEKLLAAAKEEVREALKEAITPRKKLVTDTTVVKILTEGAEAVQHLSERLRERMEVACLEEFQHFLWSYENEERSLHQPDRPSESCTKLQVFENCIVLRAAWHKLTYIYNTNADMDAKVKEIISRIEEEGREYLWKAIAPEVKATLKKHFRSHDSHLAKFLVPLKSNLLAFEKKGTDSYDMLIRAIHHRIVMEYVQALLTGYRKSRPKQQRSITCRIEQDYETLQDLFVKCLGPEASSGNNPIKVILEFNEDTNFEGKKIHLINLIPVLEKVPHLRKEHLTTILDMEGTLSQEDRNKLLNMLGQVEYEMCLCQEGSGTPVITMTCKLL
ncbi:hypothetical protein Y1Q_0015062 [Alligator mississippiensis]|uniref:Exocyst complex component 3 n=1 Tax=Alligator mississippiensis TaxID=8496 RepID=A0A151P8G2_ALLMI|nr:hypothetical protein Y1Q_0015062 [Alligator mississippiensis]